MPCGKQSAKLISDKSIDQLKLDEKLKNFIIVLILSVFLLIGVFFFRTMSSDDQIVLTPQGSSENPTKQSVSQTELDVSKDDVNDIVDIKEKQLSANSNGDLEVNVQTTQKAKDIREKIDILILKMDQNKGNTDDREMIKSEMQALIAQYNALILPTAIKELEISTQLNR